MRSKTKLDHSTFAKLLPSEKQRLLDEVAKRIPMANAELIWFTTGSTDRTYVVCELTYEGGRKEWATWLVAFSHGRHAGTEVYFDSGHYGMQSLPEAINDAGMRAR